MGINDLLKTLRSIEKPKHLSYFKGKKIGIDTYCWLHKIAYICGDEIIDGDYRKFFFLVKKMVLLFINNGTIPIFIFDGNRISIKNTEESKREYRRNANKKNLEYARNVGNNFNINMGNF